jgi:hypothetical protein
VILPCKHEERLTKQVAPTIKVLSNLDSLHPEVLEQHGIEPDDYKGGLVFRSAIESIRGSFAASYTSGREALVRDVLENLVRRGGVVDYKQSGSRNRYDFEVAVERGPDYFAAIEVKGGEGNSINISDRPVWAKEFGVWCHLDGAIVNQPAHGAHSVVNRITNELTRRKKLVDVLFFKDVLCGTRTRPCPKYPNKEEETGLLTAPDVFLLPKRVPSLDDRVPPVHTLKSLRLTSAILDLFGVKADEYAEHIWEVEVEMEEKGKGRVRRLVRVRHKGQVVDESKSRAWSLGR